MKKDKDVQTMIDELWLLAKDKLGDTPTAEWVREQFENPNADFTQSRGVFLVELHTKHVRGIAPRLPANLGEWSHYWKNKNKRKGGV